MKTRRLLRRDITYSSAREGELNILHQLGYYDKQTAFFAHLNNHQAWIRSIVAHHLNLTPGACHVSPVDDWLHGSFNVCIPVTVHSRRFLLRCPLPYRIGEDLRPGNGDEKVRCEAGAYAWLEENCPGVPIPSLYGFGLSSGETFTHVTHLPLLHRWYEFIRRRLLSWLGQPVPSKYIPHPSTQNNTVKTGHLLLEYIEPGRESMLSNTWAAGRHDSHRRANLFRDLSRILLTISRIPLPRIGSFIIDNTGFLLLANRPLSSELHELENEHIPTGIEREYTYSTVDSYVSDVLGFHDSRFRHQPNAINDLGDCVFQVSSLSAMRTISRSFFQKHLDRGPFVFVLTDLHQSNIFVDADWNVTCLVDLEWACSLPIELAQLPRALTDKSIDEIIASGYDAVRTEFIDALIAEEKATAPSRNGNMPILSNVLNQTWASGTAWYALALSSPSGLFAIFQKYIRPLFITDNVEDFHVVMPFLWDKNIKAVASKKLSDKKEYDEKLRREFE
ncbi:hypothetical protein BDV18DRAFT_95642, partial [Aspergillus unguis]